ncbi:MAG: DNRLRE domain-containing protein [Syntrophomonadaceae bacterium]|nr:DNRLRE domain-containing protein [Syntrophomonadaceae bacterium]
MASITLLPSQDAYISEWYAEQNFGSSIALFVSQYKQPGDDYRSLLQFDLKCIPPTSTIEKAELKLTMYRNEVNSAGVCVNVHRLLNNWCHCTVKWNNQPPFYPNCDGSVFIGNTTPLGLQTIDITKLVKGWYDGSIPNNGLLLMGNEAMNDLVAFRSSNYSYSNAWPMLKIKFVDGILTKYRPQEITIPCPPDCPIIESDPINLGPREKATFMITNASDSPCVKVKVQVGFEDCPDAVFFDAGQWHKLDPQGYPGEAIALSTTDASELARVLVWGEGGETVMVFPRTREE